MLATAILTAIMQITEESHQLDAIALQPLQILL
jgi:hypothetical protein